MNKIELNKKKSIYEIKNQVVAQYAQIESQKEKIYYQSQLLTMAENEYARALEDQDAITLEAHVSLLNSLINTKKQN